MKRKAFIKSGGRFLILSGIAITTGYLFAKDKVDITCSVSVICQDCKELKECNLPQAKELKDGKK